LSQSLDASIGSLLNRRRLAQDLCLFRNELMPTARIPPVQMPLSRRAIAALLFARPTLGLRGQGVLYLTTTEFMPCHGAALGVTWADVSRSHQAFLLGVIQAMGAGSVGVTLALAILLGGPFRRGETWARWAIMSVGVVFPSLTGYAAHTIDVGTPASTPWRLTFGLTALYLAGGLIDAWRPPARG
jgi:hypothetical protein